MTHATILRPFNRFYAQTFQFFYRTAYRVPKTAATSGLRLPLHNNNISICFVYFCGVLLRAYLSENQLPAIIMCSSVQVCVL